MTHPPFHRVAVVMGGLSAERAVSLVSGRECAAGLRAAGFDVVEIDAGAQLGAQLAEAAPDVVFNALHGRWGEDGCAQGVFEMMRLPYTHSGVLASALAMDKQRSKQAFVAAGLDVAHSVLAPREDVAADHVLAPPYVAKPYNEGSSVGVHIVSHNSPPPTLGPDDPDLLMVEEYLPGREVTVAVMGPPGEERPLGVTEIIVSGWYDYEAKYAAGGSRHVIPADIPAAVSARAQDAAVSAHCALGCRGLSRADFRYDPATDRLTILEVNTQPGMTPTSLAPEQAAHAGMSFSDLTAWLVADASVNR